METKKREEKVTQTQSYYSQNSGNFWPHPKYEHFTSVENVLRTQ